MRKPVNAKMLDTPTYQTLMERYRLSPTQLAEMMTKHEIDPDVFEKLMQAVLDKYRSLDVYGSKAALQRAIEDEIENACH